MPLARAILCSEVFFKLASPFLPLDLAIVKNKLEIFFTTSVYLEVPLVIMLAANAYHLMRVTDPLNHWTYIREVCPEICTLHSVRLFPDDKIFSNAMHFLHECTVLKKGESVEYDDFIFSMASYVCLKAGFLVSFVSKQLKEERTATNEGYRNIIDGLLTIRLGCQISGGVIHNISIRETEAKCEKSCFAIDL